jgi:peptidoglycan/LPS O-acetylase OafA/YrhL
VEVEFYCIFPLVWWCFKRAPWLTAAGAIAIAWAWRAWFAHCCYSGLFAQYEENLPGYLDIFAIGMLTSYAFVRYGDRLKNSAARFAGPLVALAGFACAIGLLQNLFDYRMADQWAGVWQIDKRPLLGAAFSLVAFGSLVSPRWWQVVLDNVVLRFLATISYNLYLYHQLIARDLLKWHVPPYPGDQHYFPGWELRYTQVAFSLTILQATIVTYFFERPLLHVPAPRLVRSPRGELSIAWSQRSGNAAARSSKPRSP